MIHAHEVHLYIIRMSILLAINDMMKLVVLVAQLVVDGDKTK